MKITKTKQICKYVISIQARLSQHKKHSILKAKITCYNTANIRQTGNQ